MALTRRRIGQEEAENERNLAVCATRRRIGQEEAEFDANLAVPATRWRSAPRTPPIR
jgi:hypothetical protein